MFQKPSNAACNNTLFTFGTIGRMTDDVHESATRLYAAAKVVGIEGKSALARLLNESPQVVNNWERRGVSEGGAIKAQAVIGCNAVHVLTGQGEPMLAWPFKRVPLAKILSLELDDLSYVEGALANALSDVSPMPSDEALKVLQHQERASQAQVKPVAKRRRA